MNWKDRACKFHRRLTDPQERGFGIVLLRAVLWPVSLFYGFVSALRNCLYDMGLKKVRCVSVPVISVGNVTAGGTGKTPFVAWLCRRLKRRGKSPAILSRGYGADATTGIDDENEMLATLVEDVPIVVNADRAAGAKYAIDRHGSDVLVMDDGFQHRRLARDCDIVLLDALNPFGGGHLIPLGMLRESISGLSRADAVVITRTDQVSGDQLNQLRGTIQRYAEPIPVAMARHSPCGMYEVGEGSEDNTEDEGVVLSNGRWGAFCAIGNPQAFRRTLESLGADIAFFRAYADHHAYDQTEMDELCRGAKTGKCAGLVTTEKDARKIRRLVAGGDGGRPSVWALRVSMEVVVGESDLWGEIERTLG
ncbi:MAG: tetraacyldisaccharide 4'-kinase [Planctomycetota bacterium]